MCTTSMALMTFIGSALDCLFADRVARFKFVIKAMFDAYGFIYFVLPRGSVPER